MNCPNCNYAVEGKRKQCERCGTDIAAYKNLIYLSNSYYNQGLEKAKVRDLSGAILVLRQSLEKNKRNTSARNLLGLLYYETGETVSALTEWVISKHFEGENNDADGYINFLQANPTRLDTLNQTIKKYNLALIQAKQGNEDLAILQLKKVLSLNPKFVKGLQLISLLYIKNKEYDKALKQLSKALKIDISNTTTLRYIREVEELMGGTFSQPQEGSSNVKKEKIQGSGEKSVFLASSYKEDKPNIWPIINLFLGAVIGALIVFFLIIPSIKSLHTNQLNELRIEQNEAINKKDYSISELKAEVASLQAELDGLNESLQGQEVKEYDEAMFDSLFQAGLIYIEEVAKGGTLNYMVVAESLRMVNPEVLQREGAIALYEKMKEAAFIPASKDKYNEAHKLYTARKYAEAEPLFLEAYDYDNSNVNTIYFLGRTYHQLGDKEKALNFYSILVNDFPDSSRAQEARPRIQELQ